MALRFVIRHPHPIRKEAGIGCFVLVSLALSPAFLVIFDCVLDIVGFFLILVEIIEGLSRHSVLSERISLLSASLTSAHKSNFRL